MIPVLFTGDRIKQVCAEDLHCGDVFELNGVAYVCLLCYRRATHV